MIARNDPMRPKVTMPTEAIRRIEALTEERDALKAENERMAAALGQIASQHVPDQPAAYGGDELSWVQRQYDNLRWLAKNALPKPPVTP